MLAYLISTFAVLAAVPLSQQGNLVSLVLGIQLGFGGSAGHLLGDLCAVIYLGFFLFATVVFNYSFARLPFVSGLDRRLPLIVSNVNRFRVPWVALLIQTVIAGVIALGIFILAPLVVKQQASGDLATIIYDLIQASLAVIWCLSLIFLFVDVILILRRYPTRFTQRQLAPRWVFVSAAIVGSAASLVAILVTFTNPWTVLVSTSTWNIGIASLVVACLAIGAALYLQGERRLAHEQTDAELLRAVCAHQEEVSPQTSSSGREPGKTPGNGAFSLPRLRRGERFVGEPFVERTGKKEEQRRNTP